MSRYGPTPREYHVQMDELMEVRACGHRIIHLLQSMSEKRDAGPIREFASGFQNALLALEGHVESELDRRFPVIPLATLQGVQRELEAANKRISEQHKELQEARARNSELEASMESARADVAELRRMLDKRNDDDDDGTTLGDALGGR